MVDLSPEERKGAPTPKMLSYATRIANKLGLEISRATTLSFEECRLFIDAHKDEANRPSEKRLAFAHRLAEKKTLTIPSTSLADSRSLSQWIGKHK